MATLRVLPLAVLLFAAGASACEPPLIDDAAAAATVAAPAQEVALPLSVRIGQPVEFRGVLEGRAKLGLFMIVDGEHVYLRDPPMPRWNTVGPRVVVTGVLEHFEPPVDAGCGDGCEQADVPAHWYLRNVNIQLDFQAPDEP